MIFRNLALFSTQQPLVTSHHQAPNQPPTADFPFAVILPHHQPAQEFNLDFAARLATASSQPTQVIVVGPQHQPTAHSIIATSNLGILDVPALVNDDILLADHAFTAQLLYLESAFPQASIHGILINSRIDMSQLQKLLTELEENFSPSQTLYLGSIDFSHYLPLHQAETNDEQMTRYLLQNQPESIIGLDDDFLDSWPALYLIWKLANRQETAPQIIAHTNSAYLENGAYSSDSTTSYFYLIFPRPQPN